MSQKRQGGPPPRGVMMPGAAKGAGKSFVRLLSYMKKYWLQLVLVLVCILVSAIAGVAGSTFLQTLIDDYISPMLLDGSRDFSGLARALTRAGRAVRRRQFWGRCSITGSWSWWHRVF